MRYKFYNNGKNQVICVSHFAGKEVKGVAKCNTHYDTFDAAVGETIAKFRCDLKIARLKIKRSRARIEQDKKRLEEAKEALTKSTYYNFDAHNEQTTVLKNFRAYLQKIKNK